MRHAIIALVLLSLGATACATGSSDGRRTGRRDLLTAEELAEHPELSAYEVIEQLRPTWLQARRGEGPPRIVLDRSPVERDILHSIRVTEIESMRLLSAGVATTRYGTGYQAGAIEVLTKR